MQYLGDRLLQIPHIRRIRFASKGLAVAPGRLLCDEDGDGWAAALVQVAGRARELGKSVALHTHFNHPSEVSWVTEAAAQRLYASGVTVRNQTVLLKGVNDDVETMATLIRRLADNNIHPVSDLDLYGCGKKLALTSMRTVLCVSLRHGQEQ